MDLKRPLLRHGKDSRFLVAGFAALLAICGFAYYMLQRSRGLPEEMATNKLLLFVLWYINIILIVTILFVLVRSLFRLLIERQNRILGSKFKTKLVVTAIALSLIPVLILFPFATRLLLDSFDQWFAVPVDEVVDEAHRTAEFLEHSIEERNLNAAERTLERIRGFDLDDLQQQPDLQHTIQVLREDSGVHYLAVYDGTELIHGTADVAAVHRMPDIRSLTGLLEEAMTVGWAERVVEEPFDIEGRLFVSAAAMLEEAPPSGVVDDPGSSGSPAAGSTATGSQPAPSTTPAVVLAGSILPPEVAETSDRLITAYQSYLQLSVQKDDLRAAYLLNLLMVTLLVILAFSSIGLRLARRVTAPIQALAAGTHRVRRGDLDHQVDVEVDDELGVLVDAFNDMTRELKRNRELVDHRSRQLATSGKRLAAVLQNVAAGVVAIGSDGRVLTCNGAALAILAQRESEVVDRPVREVWSDPERGALMRLLDEELTGGGQIKRQLQMTIGGVWKTLEVKVTTLPDPEGRPVGRVIVLEDLTELIQAQQMATWNEVARRIAHEIKNPLTPIQLNAERLLRKYESGDPHFADTLDSSVQGIVREVGSLKQMVDEFSRYARMPRPRPRAVELQPLFDELVRLHSGLKPGVALHAHVAPDADTAMFDPEQLKAVLINLVGNAIEASDGPGEVALRSRRAGSDLLIEVSDTGRGIEPADREKIFLPYFSTKGRGTGLGLAIVHRIVADHRGKIEVGDNHPRGALFTLRLASAPEDAPIAGETSAPRETSAPGEARDSAEASSPDGA